MQEGTIPPTEIEAELQRILFSPTFQQGTSPSPVSGIRSLQSPIRRKRKLSRNIQSAWKYSAAVDDYDTGTDPIVRVEARRLRVRLG